MGPPVTGPSSPVSFFSASVILWRVEEFRVPVWVEALVEDVLEEVEGVLEVPDDRAD